MICATNRVKRENLRNSEVSICYGKTYEKEPLKGPAIRTRRRKVLPTMQKLLSEVRELHADEWDMVAGGNDPPPGTVGPVLPGPTNKPSYSPTSCYNGQCFMDHYDDIQD